MSRTRAPRLLVLTQYWPPELGAPQARLSESAQRLAQAGWDVQILTALPNYPTGRLQHDASVQGIQSLQGRRLAVQAAGSQLAVVW